MDRNFSGNVNIRSTRSVAYTANRTVGGNINVFSPAIFQIGGAQVTVSGNVTVDEGAQIGCSNNSGTLVAAGPGTQTFTLNGICRVASNSTQTPNPTGGFNRQFAFDDYTFGANSIVSFRNPTTGSGVILNIDQPAGKAFANVEFYNIQTAAFTTTFFLRQNIVVTGSIAFPRIASGQPIVFDMDGKNLTVGGNILNSLGTIGTNVGNTNTSTGTRTYTMSGTLELNGTAAQTTLGGTDLPSTFNNLTINNTHASGVTTNNAITVSGTTTINANSMLSMGATLTANGAANVNGTFRLNSGGWATGTGAWNYGSNGTLAFNATYGVDNNHVYWPTTNGPVNVSVATGVLTLNSGANRTVNGLFQTSHGVAMNGATLTLNGTAQINAGGYFSNAPIYGPSSTLRYNTGGTFGRSIEWNKPANVQISNNTTLNYPNSGVDAFSANLSIPGNLTVDAGSSLFMDWGGGDNKSGRLTVGGNVTLAGNLSLGNAIGGDLYVGGNWTRTAGAFTPNGREVRFIGTSNQSINNTTGETFAWLTIANTAGNTVTMNNNVTVTNNLEILAASALTLATDRTLQVNGNFHLRSTSGGTATLVNNGTLTVSGTTTAQQFLAHARNWYVSSPLSAAVVPASGYTVFSRNEPGSNWLTVTNPGQFTPGVGYIALPSAAGSTLTFTGGTFNTGDVNVSLTRSGVSAAGFNLVGNPYPAHLTWTKAFTDANESLIQPTIWYRTNAGTVNNSGQWSFQTFNAFSGTGVPETTTGVIPPMQSFWVRALAPGTLTFTNNLVRSHQSNNPLKAPASNNAMPQLRMELTNGTVSDEILIYFHELAQNEFDRYDSPKFMDANAALQLYSLLDNEQLVINGLNHLNLPADVPLGFRTNAAGQYQMRAFRVQNFDPLTRIILRDNQLNTETELTEGSLYTFDTDPSSNHTRFTVLFRSADFSTDAPDSPDSALSLTKVFANNGRIVVEGVTLAEERARIRVYNQTGQLMVEKTATSNRNELNMPTAKGIYIVVVQSANSKITQKIQMR